MGRIYILFLFLGFSAQVAAAIPYRVVEQWTAADGLPAENIAGLAVDSDHQLWLATYDGIVRYQGFDFQHYNRASQPALPGNRYSRILPAPGGGVIVQLEDGHFGHLARKHYRPLGQAELGQLAVFNQQFWFICSRTRALWSWHPSADLKRRTRESISVIAVDTFNQRLLLGTATGRVLYLTADDQQVRPLLENGATAILGLASGPAGELLVLDAEHAREYQDAQSGAPSQVLRFERQQTPPVRVAWTERGWLLANLLSPVGAGPHLINDTGLARLPVPQPTSAGADRSPSRIEFVDPQGRRWINDGQQLFRNGQLVFTSEARITDFIVDPFDQVWLSQPIGGLRLLKQTMIEVLGNGPGELIDSNISLVTEQDGQVLVGSWVELSRLDPETGVWTRMLRHAVRDVLPDDGGLLVGTHGLCQLEAEGDCQTIADFPGGLAEVLMLHRDASGEVWAGTESGLFRRDLDRRWQPELIHPATVRTALEDASGRLLFGTNGHGVLVLERSGSTEFSLRLVGPEQGLSSEFVRALLPVPGGGTLVGTEDAGLCLLGSELNVVNCISLAEGLPHHSVHYLVLDDAGRVWVNSNGGVYWVNQQALLSFLIGATTATPDFYRLGQRHGLTSIEGNGGVYRAGARTADGRIWFPNQRGLVSIRPDEALFGREQALTTRMRAVGQIAEEALHLPRHERHLEVELTAIALAEPENVQFRYRFDTDTDWTEVGRRRNLNFRDLQPGQHFLEVSSRYVNTPWSGAPVRLEFSAGYRLHEHPVFHALLLCAGLFAMAGVWLAGRQRQKRLEKEIEDRSSQLSIATEQVAGLAGALERVGVQHRTAFQAVSRELKSALNAAMEPLLRQSGRKGKGREFENLHLRTRTLSAMIDQIGSFADCEQDGATSVRQDGESAPSRVESPKTGLTPSGNGIDLAPMIRMEVLLHLADPDFSVDQLARRLGVSRSVLYRQVAEITESSPAELIRDLRLEEAAKQLRDTEDQVSSIAYATGFRSVSAFSRAFSKKMGVSPRQWRRQAIQLGADIK